MALAIVVSWAKLNRCTKEEWENIVANCSLKTNLDFDLHHRSVSESYYKTKS